MPKRSKNVSGPMSDFAPEPPRYWSSPEEEAPPIDVIEEDHIDDDEPHPTDGGQEHTLQPPSLASDVKDTVQSVKRAVQEQVGRFTSDIGHELGKTAEGQKMRGVEAMQAFARAVSTAAGDLETNSPLVARYARDAARRVEGLSGNISGRSVSELMDSATGLARSQPALFFAGVVFAGFALSRFMKSSAPRDLPKSYAAHPESYAAHPELYAARNETDGRYTF